MTGTRDKLNETKYFFNRMDIVHRDSDAFRYEFTAFLSAARSVTQIMQNEYSKEPGFARWYSQKQDEMRKNPVLKYLHEQRRLSFHVRPAKTTSTINLEVHETICVTESVALFLEGTGGITKQVTVQHPVFGSDSQGTSKIGILYSFDDFPGKNVMQICQEDLIELENLVNECEQRFPSINA